MQGKINPTNYEAYFLLYVDNELSGDERAEVETFLQQHPETQPLLEELLRTRQVADPAMVFPGKSKLFFGAAAITDEALLSYLDKEAVPAAVSEALQHPSPELAQRLQAFERTIAEPDKKVVFPDKTRLYRTSKRGSINMWRMAAAAAMVVIAVGAAFWMQQPTNKVPLADVDHPRLRDSFPGNGTAGAPADDTPVATDTLPRSGKETAIAIYKASDEGAHENRTVKKERQETTAVVGAVIPAKSTTAASKQSIPVLRSTGEVSQTNAAVVTNKIETTPPPAPEQDPSVHQAVVAASEEKQPKEKKSLFKKLTQRIEDRVSGALIDGDGQVTIAGFAVNVK